MKSLNLAEQRLVVVTNPNSTGSARVQREVLDQLNEYSIPYHHLTTNYPDAEANIDDLATHLHDGDRVIGAIGDGTAGQLANAALLSATDIELGILPYGNFNDIASVHTKKSSVIDLLSAESIDVIPLDILFDEEHWRYAVAYFSIGWTAVASAEFSDELSRSSLQRQPRALKFSKSILQIAGNYFSNRQTYLPPFHTSISPDTYHRTTDVIAINHPRVAGIVRTAERFYDKEYFGYKDANISRILPNIPFILQALIGRAPLTPLSHLDVVFEDGPEEVSVQTEGESVVKSAHKISIEKDPSRILKILHSK